MTYWYNTAINIDNGVLLVKLQIISIMMMASLKIGMSKPGLFALYVLEFSKQNIGHWVDVFLK